MKMYCREVQRIRSLERVVQICCTFQDRRLARVNDVPKPAGIVNEQGWQRTVKITTFSFTHFLFVGVLTDIAFRPGLG